MKMLWSKGKCPIFMLLLLPVMSHAQGRQEVSGKYVYTFSDRDGRPSKCDCDYLREEITLKLDGSFLYLNQRGRLDPKQEFQKGTWSLKSDSIVVLQSTHQKGAIDLVPASKTDPNSWKPCNEQKNSLFTRTHCTGMGVMINSKGLADETN